MHDAHDKDSAFALPNVDVCSPNATGYLECKDGIMTTYWLVYEYYQGLSQEHLIKAALVLCSCSTPAEQVRY